VLETVRELAWPTVSVGAPPEKIRRVTFLVTLFPAAEVVFISGTDMNPGSSISFHVFAFDRRDVLRRTKKIDDGALATIFSCDHRWRRTFVHSNSGWLVIHEKSHGTFDPAIISKPHTFAAGDISAVEVYLYLDVVGKAAPGRVKEVGWFGHAFGGGPVLWNNWDLVSGDERDPNDHDARAKDFNPTQIKKWPDMKAALAKDCVWRTWGCRADTHDRRRIYYGFVNRKLKDDVLFKVDSKDKHGKVGLETMTRAWLNAELDRLLRDSYCAAAARFLGIPCLGSPPGVGSDLATVAGLHCQMVNLSDYSYVYSYLSGQFRPEFKATNTTYDKGYLDYKPMLARKVLTKPALGPDRYRFTDPASGGGWKLEWEGGKSDSGTGKVTLKVTAKKGFGAAKLDGFLYEVVNTDKTKSKAYFATGAPGAVKVFHVTLGTSGKFDTLDTEL
jgi:hypothetical protein